MVRRVLVTGGAGFVGSHLVDLLVASGLEVRVLDALHPGAHAERPGYLNPGAEYRFADLRDGAAVEAALAGVDAVSHQASMVGLGIDLSDAPDYVGHNGLGTATLLAALHRGGFRGRLVLASSMVVYGEGAYACEAHGPVRPGPRDAERLAAGAFEPGCPVCGRDLVPRAVSEDGPLDPRSVYAATKLLQEHLCAAFSRGSGAPAAALRYHNVYGPRMPRDTPYAGVASIFRSALEAGRPPTVFEDGRQVRDFVHVQDVARANLIALTTEPAPRGAFNVASGDPHTIGEMARALARAFGPDAPRPVVTGEVRPADVRHVFALPERARRELGFRAAVRFEDGIAELASAELRSPV